MRIVLLLLASFLITACVHTRTTTISVEFGDRQTLYFTGKGAAAGIMMDAYLGGAGVAVGIAIDEGIAKDISAAIQKSNPEFDIRDVVKKQLVVVSDEISTKNWQSLVIEKYGFQVVDGDFVSPILELAVNCNGSAETIRFERNLANPDKVELDLIKSDGTVGVGLLQQAVEETMTNKRLSALCKK